MPERRLPLDADVYRGYIVALRALVEADPTLEDTDRLRMFVREHRERFGPRTVQTTLDAPDDRLRVLVHVMVLAASELSEFHEASREWLQAHGHTPPPWDVTVPRTAQRLITVAGKVRGVVEWEPERRVELDPGLSEPDRRWATALAIGIGECPQWSEDEVWRYAAYLALGVEEFAAQRAASDEELAERHGIPVDAVRYRRGLPDVLREHE
jgi:hypothetical protein